ncbi:preprotein translocase subunit SecE, partial [Methylophilaceae bacterium]|nr:preprotein translocase subunit SecE [Methylophilaceae bacterium]
EGWGFEALLACHYLIGVNSLSDKLKTTSAIVVFTLGIVGFYVLDGQPLVLQVLSVLIGLGLSLFIFKQSAKGNELFTFLNSVVLEAKKVVWPTRKETVQMTLVVFVVVVLMAIFLALVDIGFTYIVNLVLGR